MSTKPLIEKLLVSSLSKEAEVIHASSKIARYKSLDPLTFAIPAMALLSGNKNEMTPYNILTTKDMRAAHSALKTVRNLVSVKLLEHHPSLNKMLLKHPAFLKKINNGSLARMPKKVRNIRLLSLLLLDSGETKRFYNEGLFQWDNGHALTALMIDYAWRQSADSSHWMTQKPRDLIYDAQALSRHVFKKYIDEELVQSVRARYFQSWYHLPDWQTKENKYVYQSLTKTKNSDTQARLKRLLGQSSLLDLGVRTRNADLLKESIENVRPFLSPNRSNSMILLPYEAWALSFENKNKEAKELLLKIPKTQSKSIKSQAIPILMRTGEKKKALEIYRKIIKNQN